MKTKTNEKRETDRCSMSVDPYSRLVALPVKSENVFHFPDGLPAFESVKEFVFLCKPDTRPFFYMQALNPADLAFVCIDPFLIYPGYEPRISSQDVKFLHLSRPEDAMIISIVTVTRNVQDITVNLQGPVVINIQGSIGKQVICEGQDYAVRYRMWDALRSVKANSEIKVDQKYLTTCSAWK